MTIIKRDYLLGNMFTVIYITYCFSSHNSWNSESSDSESDETENRRPPPSKSLNRRAAQKAKEKARVRKKHISESSDNSSFDSDDNRRYISRKILKKEKGNIKLE